MRKFQCLACVLSFCTLVSACGQERRVSGGAESGQGAAQEAAGVARKQPPLHPAFNLTREGLAGLTAELAPETRNRILASPAEFLGLMDGLLKEAAGLLVLVDKKHSLPPGWEPPDLVNLKDYPLRISRQDFQLRAVVMPALLEMAQAASRDGAPLLLSSTYRSEVYQRTVYSRNVRELGQAAADRESARPGHSQHQLGTVIDFGSISDDFAGTKMERWLDANAWKYGFSLSFPDGLEELTGYRYESWHFRYIGRPAAEMARVFFGGVQQFLLEFLHSKAAAFAACRTRA